MATTEPSSPETTRLLPRTLSFLAPAAWVVLPALALAYGPGSKDEAYEWTQHRVTALLFAGAFASALLKGVWRQGWPATLAALPVLAFLVIATARGLPGFHGLFAVAGGLVALGYRLAPRSSPAPLPEVLAVGFCSILCFWAVSRLLWWQPFEVTMASWSNRMIFLAASSLPILGLDRIFREETPGADPRRAIRGLDILALALLAAAVARTNSLIGNLSFPHHWSVYAAPVELVQEGRALLGEVPSQYGFLTTLLLAGLPVDNSFTAIFWLNSATLWASGAIIYFTLRTWWSHWAWQLVAAVTTISVVAFLCGDASALTGPMVYPSAGALRFVWLHVLLGFLLWTHLSGKKNGRQFAGDRRSVWIGSGLWLAGVLWSVESAAYVTAAWFPAGALLAMDPAAAGATPLARFRALLTGIGRLLLITAFLLVLAVFLIGTLSYFLNGRVPEWSAYWEYATAFSQGFGVLPVEPSGGVWVLLLLHTALLAAVVSLDPDRERSAVALIWGAWGALWSVSTYFVSRSHPNNITTLGPVLLLVVGLLVHALRRSGPAGLARPWIWLSVPPTIGAMLWLVFTNGQTLRAQLTTFDLQPQAALLLPAHPPGLDGLIDQCLARQPGRFVVIGHTMEEVVWVPRPKGSPAWLPLSSLPLLAPLPVSRRIDYLDKYRRERVPGWLIAPADLRDPNLHWLLDYINTRYAVKYSLTQANWAAWYCVPAP